MFQEESMKSYVLHTLFLKKRKMDKSSSSGSVRRMQSNLQKVSTYTSRLTISKKSTNNKCWRGFRELCTLYLLVRHKGVTANKENRKELCLKVKMEEPFNPQAHHWTSNLRRQESRRHRLQKMQCSLIHNSQNSEGIKMSNNRWMDKEEVVRVHNGILAMEDKEPLLFEAPQMSLQIIMKDEVSWKAKDLYSMISLIGVIW